MAHIGMFESCITGHWFSSKGKEIWSDLSTLQAWLDVEAALAQAQSKLGMIPVEAAEIITEKANANLLDMEKISADIKSTMHPFVPVLRQFEALCGDAAGYIHWGATTQNIFDTALVLQLRETHHLLLSSLANVMHEMSLLAEKTKLMPQPGRSHGQHALPITFGFKVAGWRAEIRRQYQRLEHASEDAFIASMGGAVGTFSAMSGQGRLVQQNMAEILKLKSNELPVRSSCDSLSAYITQFGLLASTIEKIAQEVIFLQRTEVAEIEESFHRGKVGSSTMSQKRNPQHAQNLVGMSQLLQSRMSLCNLSMVRMNEGDAAASNIFDAAIPEIAITALSISEGMEKLIAGLCVYPDNMMKNLNMTGGLILSEAVMMELANTIGRAEAHHVLYEAAMNSVEHSLNYSECIMEELHKCGLSDKLDMENLMNPVSYLGEAPECVDDELKRNVTLNQ
ncbi:class-II fumarase/aspartase family protein [Vibrio mangrovi]|uniref:Adenylosuccinate lyase n=1 Tax=Vibrio mangrovi TaxID=474394 RepID=A0A1Y6ITD7_9VIBR|nr:adenylosuccinate lyase family protein [Vibrio mangrovi]MDW6004625.1 adenylosuccinate lyase family protein [Vibrio mangrovi]SMS00915.1 Adenylosuccinate lyase [Vibrio mangrovi]